MTKNIFRKYVAVLIAVFSFSVFAQAQTSPTTFPNINIKNFGQMDENYYRGAQPKPEDYASLAALGIKTVVDLRDDPTNYAKASAEAAGLKYINVPMSGWRSPRDVDINRVLSILKDPASGKVYVHCKAGIHRTGMTGAIYRMNKYGWSFDKAFAEMKNYNYSTGLIRMRLTSYIKDYAKHNQNKTAPVPAVQTAATGIAQ